METEFKADVLDVYSDSDWAGCKATRKSTSGGMLVVDGCCLRSWSSSLATVATSSGEAELYALVKAAAEGLGFQAVACDLGVELRVELCQACGGEIPLGPGSGRGESCCGAEGGG